MPSSHVTPANFRLEKGGGLTWSKPNRRNNSTEEEEEEQEEDEDKDDVIWSSPEIRKLVFARTGTPGSGKLQLFPIVAVSSSQYKPDCLPCAPKPRPLLPTTTTTTPCCCR